jgi:hypothetical protein
MKLTESKSNLARLFAEENLIVEQREVPTAYFDGESRLLVVPTLKETLSNDVMDLVISHETAHALWTDQCLWTHALQELKISRGILNVIEDNRIERLIKQKYPGLRVNYSRGYRELMSMDFFGLSELDIEGLNLIDKINLQSKVGFIQGIEFSEEEQVFMDKTEKTKTFDDVIKLSKEIQDYIKEKFEEERQNLGESEETFEQDGSSSEESESEDMDGFEFGGATVTVSQQDSDDESDEDSDELGYKGVLPTLEEMLESKTDEASQIKIKALYSDSHKQSVYVDVPDIKLTDYIIDYRLIYERLYADVPERFVGKNHYNNFKKTNYDVISYLVKEFLLKKNAEGRKKAKISKTGDINLSKIYAYKITDDVFKRSTIVPKSQSHGLVFFLDWSGSMVDYMEDTIKQMMCMLLFCEKLNIPYEVYAFSSQAGHYFDNIQEKAYSMNTALLNPLKLMNLFSSRMSKNEFIKATNYLMSMGRFGFLAESKDKAYYTEQKSIPQWFMLGNTPLNHTILLSDKVLSAFKERTRVNIVNAIYLTDGDSHGIRYVTNCSGFTTSSWLRDSRFKTYIRSKTNKVSKYLDFTRSTDEQETNHCVSFIKECCDFRFFGFRLVNPYEMRRKMYNYANDSVSALKKFNKENCFKNEKTTFDEFYFVKANAIKEKDEIMPDLGEKETVSNITKKFQKAVSAKTNNRVFLRKFIEFIS